MENQFFVDSQTLSPAALEKKHRLENDPTADAVNYHFTEQYAGDEILFDYTIHPGRCTTTNARHLLRLAGILPAEPPVSPPDR